MIRATGGREGLRRPDIPVLTALRFPAAAAIVWLHLITDHQDAPEILAGLTSGVSFFYVLSGFILYYNYVDLSDRGAFWIARLARIWPLHLVTLLMALIFEPFHELLGHDSWPMTLPLNLLLLHAWLPFKGSALSYNGVSWSLSVEAFFYLAFPWLLVWMKRTGVILLWVCGFLFSLGFVLLAQWLFPEFPGMSSYHPLARVFEFTLGMGACQWWFQEKRQLGRRAGWSWLELVGVVGLVVLMLPGRVGAKMVLGASPLSDWLITAVSAIGFAVLVWVFAHHAGRLSRFLAFPLFVLLGEVSFAVYMCHQIILRVMESGSLRHGLGPDWLWVTIYLIVTLLVSSLLYIGVESPCRRWILQAYRRWKSAT